MLMKGDKGLLRLEVLGYENAHAQHSDDANWLQARLEVAGGPFSGSIAIALTSNELSLLYQQLTEATQTLKGEFLFENMEGNWVMSLTFERTGTAIVRGKVTPYPAEENSLQYEFRTDGITLEGVVRDLHRMSAEFPIKRQFKN